MKRHCLPSSSVLVSSNRDETEIRSSFYDSSKEVRQSHGKQTADE